MPIPKKPIHYREAEPARTAAPVISASGHDLSRASRPGDSKAMAAHHDAQVIASAGSFSASIRYANRHNTITRPTLLGAALAAHALEAGVADLGGSTRASVYALPPVDPVTGAQAPGVIVQRPDWAREAAPVFERLPYDMPHDVKAKTLAILALKN